MTTPEHSLEDFMAAAIMAGMPSANLQGLLSEHPKIVQEFAGYDPFRLAGTFGGLLTVAELQGNCVRLEALCHLALVYAHGTRKPNTKLVTQSFTAMGQGSAGRLEDPPEDVFVSSIATKRGNFRVFEGIWESAGFYLQRFVNVVETMPNGPGYDNIRDSMYALLRLSDVVCERSKLTRWQMGASYPQEKIPPHIGKSLRALRGHVTFSEDSLVNLGIPLGPLSEFVFQPSHRGTLAGEAIGHSLLERYPVLWRNNDLCLVLPTGVSAAIRRLVLERVTSSGLRESFLKALSYEYADTLSGIPLLGGALHAPIHFQRTKAGVAGAVMMQADTGRYLTFIFVMDTLEDVETTGLAGFNRIKDVIADLATGAAEAAQGNANFLNGLILIVSCGIGRAIADRFQQPIDSRWRQEFVSAPDLVTMSSLTDFTPLSLWRLLEAEDQMANAGVHLQNVNGLLNMIAWQRSLRGHLVPHNNIPDGFAAGGREAMVMIEQAGLKSLRRAVAENCDPHVEQDVTGNWVALRKVGDSLFAEDAARPLYAGTAMNKDGSLPAAYIAPKRVWWCELIVSQNTTRAMAYERWKMLNVWLSRIAAVLDEKLSDLPANSLLWRVEFEADLQPNLDPRPRIGFDDAKRAISLTIDREHRTLSMRIAEAYEGAHFNVENIAERALVERAVDGFVELAATALRDDERAALLLAIIPDGQARQTHAFRSRSYRDHVREERDEPVILIHEDDDAALRLGLGWRVRERKDGCDIFGRSDCTVFLNAVIRLLEEELLRMLGQFNRVMLIDTLLHNHECAAIDREQWKRTAAAVVSLHADRPAAFETIAQHEGRLNAVFQTTRTLIEMAQCACPESSGGIAGKLDISRIMAKMALIIHLGGWSDAIWLDAMEPRIHINPLGDIQVNHSFIESVIEPFGRQTSDVRTKDAIDNYARHLEEPVPEKTIADSFEPQFLEALHEELGVGIDEARMFLDFLDDIGLKQGRLVLTLPRSTLINPMIRDGILGTEATQALIAKLIMPRREKWHTVPDGYDDKDRQPWRYRRRLSVLRRPLIQIDDEPDPTLMFAPGLVREGLIYSLDNYYRGAFPQAQLKAKMKSWRGKTTAKRGTGFNAEVAERLRALGWDARSDVQMSTILGSPFRSLGDIDVLAWRPDTGRVLLIECKDLKFSKTLGEIAEQLADFRGEPRADGKPDDLLRHLKRIDAIAAHPKELARLVGLTITPQSEGHIVFHNPVPMQFAWDRLKSRIGLHLFDALEEL